MSILLHLYTRNILSQLLCVILQCTLMLGRGVNVNSVTLQTEKKCVCGGGKGGGGMQLIAINSSFIRCPVNLFVVRTIFLEMSWCQNPPFNLLQQAGKFLATQLLWNQESSNRWLSYSKGKAFHESN